MGWKFWKRGGGDEMEVKNVRNIGDIQIQVSTGLSNTRDIKISAWNSDMAYDLFQRVWSQLDEPKKLKEC